MKRRFLIEIFVIAERFRICSYLMIDFELLNLVRPKHLLNFT